MHIVGSYPIFELRNLYWEHGHWKFLGESPVTEEDFEWYDQHVKSSVKNPRRGEAPRIGLF